MNMTTQHFVGLIAVVLAASWGSWGLESVHAVHPAVRRGLQVAIMGATALWAFRVLQTI